MFDNRKIKTFINDGTIVPKTSSTNLDNLNLIINIFKTLIILAPVLYPVAIFLVYLEYLQYGLNILAFLDLSRIFILSIPTFIVILCFSLSVYYFYSLIKDFLEKFPNKKYWIFISFLVIYYITGSALIYLAFPFASKPNYLFFLFYFLILTIYPIPFAGIIHFFKYIRTFNKVPSLILLPIFLLFAIWLSYTPLIRHYDTIALFSQGNCTVNNDESFKLRELLTTNEYTIFYNQENKKSIFMKNTDVLSKDCVKPVINFKNN